MKTICYIAWICILISACKSGNETDTVDFDDISKPSAKYASADSSSVSSKETVPVYYDSISVFSQQLVDSLMFDRTNVFKLDTLIYPDRFGALKADKWYYISPKDSLVFMRWEFKNNVQTKNTFFNWIDCYGKHCKSIKVGDEVNFSRRATLFLLADKELIFVESGQKINPEHMLGILGNLKKQKKWDYFMLQQPRGKAAWKSIDEKGEVLDLKEPQI